MDKIAQILKSNPITKKYQDIKRSFKGIFWGFLLIFGSLMMLVFSFTMVEENSKSIDSLELLTPKEVLNLDELVKVEGEIDSGDVKYEYSFCSDTDCQYPEYDTQVIEELLFYKATYQRYELVENTVEKEVEKVVDGVTTTETVEEKVMEEDWVDHGVETVWAEVKMDGLEIDLESLDVEYELENDIYTNVYIDGLRRLDDPTDTTVSSKFGEQRVVIEYLENKGNFIAVGEVVDGELSKGNDLGLFTDMDNEDLIAELAQQEKTMRWGFRFISWAMLTIGFYLLVAPILEFVEMIPFVGKPAKIIASVTAGLFALVLVSAGIFIIKFWYIVLALALLLVGVGVYSIAKKFDKDEDEKLAKEESK